MIEVDSIVKIQLAIERYKKLGKYQIALEWENRLQNLINKRDNGTSPPIPNLEGPSVPIPDLTTHVISIKNDLEAVKNHLDVDKTYITEHGRNLYCRFRDPELIEELIGYYREGELAKREGCIFTYGKYVMQQVEAIVNYTLEKVVSITQINSDLIGRSFYDNKDNKNKKLFEFFFTGKSNGDNKIISSFFNSPPKQISLQDIDLIPKIRIYNWYFDNNKGKPSLYLDPYIYLKTARNKASHGYFSTSNENEKKRVKALTEDPYQYFLMFGATHHHIHKQFPVDKSATKT